MHLTPRTTLALALALLLPALVAADEPGKKKKKKREEGGPRLAAETFEGLELRGIGPAFMSGRIADIALHPRDRATWYVAVGSGGVWKTANAGTTWKPLFDDEGSYSIGCITLDPNHPEVVWVGTGENVGGRHVGYGNGVYRSLDGGDTWENLGLDDSQHIGRIVVDPRDSNVVYVAAQGPLWSAGGDRGLFKTSDAGKTWTKLLGGGEFTGVNDVVLDPRKPDVLYASTHQRIRTVAALVNGGTESGIHKSTDGGKTWRKLENGLPDPPMGKIGLALSPQDPDVVYAAIELAQRKGGVWRSADGGGSWSKQSDRVGGGTGPHYYQEIVPSPHRFDRLYFMEARLHVSEDGGKTFTAIDGDDKHVDNHALAFDPHDPDYLLAGCDGGLYESWDLGATWKFVSNLPVTQFYKVALDDAMPFYNVYGGTQDNGTQGGPSRTDNVNGIRNSDWILTVFADGHQPAVDPTNPDIVYGQWQVGNLVRHDRKTGEMVYIQPQPAADEPWDRFNWDSPILISPHDPKRLYHASQRVWRSDDRGDSWRPISGDLTRALDRLALPVMGRVHGADAVWDLSAMSQYGTITSLAQSPLDANLLWAGTDDGLIQVSEDGGATWRRIERLPGVGPAFINDVKADLFDADTAYVAADNHKAGDFAPHLLKTTNRGRSWTRITGDLPDRHIVWRIVQDHVRPQLLFAGTEFGVFFTVDGGGRWIELEGGVPNIPFRDLAIQRRENDLVGASFGRGFFILDDYTPLRQVSAASLEQEVELFPVRKTWWYAERRPLGDEGRASQGSAFFLAPNPPFGAVFTYYLRDEIRTRKETRRKAEEKLEERGDDTPHPGWEEIRREREEEDPAILLTVRDAAGRVMRRLTAPVSAGFHRVAWDLRYPSPRPWRPEKAGEADTRDRLLARGLLAPPGTYSVSLAKRVDGQTTDLGKSQTFEVAALREGTIAGPSPGARAAFLGELEETRRAAGAATSAIADTLERVEAIIQVLDRSSAGEVELDDRARSLLRRLRDLKIAIEGDPDRDVANDPGPVSIDRRLDVALMGQLFSTYGPTPTHRESLDIARHKLAALDQELDRVIDEDLPELERRLDAAGVPWTPGRSVPELDD